MKLFLWMCSLLLAGPAAAHAISEVDKAAMLNGGYARYVELGATHMVTGYDHLLFLFGVVFFLTTPKDVIKFVSAFTVGHSITLIVATFAGITTNYYLVDAVIALSVCYKGFDNNGYFRSYLQVRAPNLLWMVFGFGLVHGFGLSTRLQQLPLGSERLEILGRIVAFNVGVELGQVAALLAIVFALRSVRQRSGFVHWSRVANDGIIIAGVFLLLMQLHGVVHTTHPDDLGFSADLHSHAHADVAQAAAAAPPIDIAPAHDNL